MSAASRVCRSRPIRSPSPARGERSAPGRRHPTPASVNVAVRPAHPSAVTGSCCSTGYGVVEFGVAAVIPELCGVLSELGADVIKIESIAHPDVLRLGSGNLELIDKSFTFNTECRGRRSVALDLTTEKGRELAVALCASADVVAENQRGGALDARGLGYEAIRARNPGVIYVSSQGYGRGGPLGEMPAYGPLNSGFSGVHLLWNHPDAPYPCGTSLNHPDHIAGKLLAVGVLAALREREASGEGQWLHLAQTESAAYLVGEVYLEAARSGIDPQPLGNAHPAAAPHGVYPSAGDDQWVAIAVMDDAAWQRLCTATGWEPDPDLATAASRMAARDGHRRTAGDVDPRTEQGGSGRAVAGPRRLRHAGHGTTRPPCRSASACARRHRAPRASRGGRRAARRQPDTPVTPAAASGRECTLPRRTHRSGAHQRPRAHVGRRRCTRRRGRLPLRPHGACVEGHRHPR